MIIPKKLKAGDTVGIVSPSKAPRDNDYTKERTRTGVAFLESLGLKVKFAKHWEDRDFYGGATIQARIQDIYDMFLDKEVKMVMMSVGGHRANMILSHLDYDLIRSNPKHFSGFSDGTLLTNAIYLKSGIQTCHGLNLNDTLGYSLSEPIKQNFINTFMQEAPYTITENKELRFMNWATGEEIKTGYKGWNIIKGGRAKGKLTGGLLQRLITTDYAGFHIDYNNAILFFESIQSIESLFVELSSMEQRGVFKQINGLIAGYCYNIANQEDVADTIKFVLKDYDFPIIQIGELGHWVESYSFPVGKTVELDADNKVIKVL